MFVLDFELVIRAKAQKKERVKYKGGSTEKDKVKIS